MPESSEEQPFFSVVMTAYNSENYVARTIESILAQTFPNWELVIVDDHSSDYTPEIISKYASADSRIKALRNESNLYISRSANKGIAFAAGVWIVRLDSDDFFDPSYLEKLRAIIASEKVELFFISSWITVIDEYGKKILDVRLPDADTIRKMMKIENFLYQSATSFPKRLWEMVGRYPEGGRELSEDTELWKRFFNAGVKLHMLKEPLVSYRIHYSNTTSIKDAGLSFQPKPQDMKALRQNKEWRISLYLKQKMLKSAREEIRELNRFQKNLSLKNIQYFILTFLPESAVYFLMWELRPRLRYLLKNMRRRKIRV